MESQSPQPEVVPYTFTDNAKATVASGQIPKDQIGLIIGALILGIVLILGMLFFVSKNSLPDQALYGFKTHVAEEMVAFIKPTASAKSAYAVTRFERRFMELQTLATDTGTTSPEVLTKVADLSEKHERTAATALENSKTVSPEEKIDTLAKLQNLARAEELLVDGSSELSPISDRTSAVEKNADRSLSAAIETFASSSAPEAVSAYIASQISNVSEEITTVANGSKAQSLTLQRISDAEEAIVDGKLADALSYILKARQAIAVDGHLYNAERGPIDGKVIEPIPMPEGS